MSDYQRKPFAPLFEKSGLLPPMRHELNTKILNCLYYDSTTFMNILLTTAGAITNI